MDGSLWGGRLVVLSSFREGLGVGWTLGRLKCGCRPDFRVGLVRFRRVCMGAPCFCSSEEFGLYFCFRG